LPAAASITVTETLELLDGPFKALADASGTILEDGMAKKNDDLTPEHLEWLVESRSRNQRACLEIFKKIEQYPGKAKSKKYRTRTYFLVSAAFSLWRAAFLADKSGEEGSEVFTDARAFLAQIITNNAITYAQDRASRDWTFSYYMLSAANSLAKLAEKWPEIATVLSKYEKVEKGTTKARRRWNRHQTALETAIELYAAELAK
jgi:hypothetical protein